MRISAFNKVFYVCFLSSRVLQKTWTQGWCLITLKLKIDSDSLRAFLSEKWLPLPYSLAPWVCGSEKYRSVVQFCAIAWICVKIQFSWPLFFVPSLQATTQWKSQIFEYFVIFFPWSDRLTLLDCPFPCKVLGDYSGRWGIVCYWIHFQEFDGVLVVGYEKNRGGKEDSKIDAWITSVLICWEWEDGRKQVMEWW